MFVNTLDPDLKVFFSRKVAGAEGEDLVEKAITVFKEKSIPESIKPDILLVDESQDFRLSWFRLIHQIKKENTVIAFGVDETQRIYEGTDWRWKDTGFDARGRVTVLRKIYRSSGKNPRFCG